MKRDIHGNGVPPIRRWLRRGLAIVAPLIWLVSSNVGARELTVLPPGAATSTAGTTTFSSIATAMSALQPGDHLTIMPGVYRETMRFPARDWASAAQTTIEGRGTALIKGADVVTGWTAVGDGVFFKPWKNEAAQVAVDDVLLQQVGGTVFDGFPLSTSSVWTTLMAEAGGIWPGRRTGDETSLPLNSFYFEPVAGRLYLRIAATDLEKHVVEVSTRTYAALGEGLANITIKNLSFRLGNTSVMSRAGLVTLQGSHVHLDHLMIRDADSVGVELDGDDNTMDHVTTNNCGQLGIKARGARVQIRASESNFNNTRGFNKWWEAGGAKFIGNGGLSNSTITGHTAIGNHGDGVWFDWGNMQNRIDHCYCSYNAGFGIQYEASTAATIVDNVVVGNEQRGIYLPHSSDSVIAYNLVAVNHLEGIAIMDEGRTDPDGILNLRPRDNRVFGNVLAWNGAALTLPAVRASNTSDGNVYVEKSSSIHLALGWNIIVFGTLPAWRAGTGQDMNSAQIQQAVDVPFIASVAEMHDPADLGWYRQLRARLQPVTDQTGVATPAAVLAGGPADERPGPAL